MKQKRAEKRRKGMEDEKKTKGWKIIKGEKKEWKGKGKRKKERKQQSRSENATD